MGAATSRSATSGAAARTLRSSLPKTPSPASASASHAPSSASRPAGANIGVDANAGAGAGAGAHTRGGEVAQQVGRTMSSSGVYAPERAGPVPGRNQGASEEKDEAIRRDAFDPDFISQLNRLGPVSVSRPPWEGHSPSSGSSSRPGEHPGAHAPPSETPVQGQAGLGLGLREHAPARKRGPSQMERILQARREREEAAEAQVQAQAQGSGAGGSGSANSAQAWAGDDVLPHDAHHLDAGTLALLLDEIKGARSRGDITRIARDYDFDEGTLDVLRRRFNAPDVGPRVVQESERASAKQRDGHVPEGEKEGPTRMYAVWNEPPVPARSGATS